jgi:NADH-quinone oxidoreductase subunit G
MPRVYIDGTEYEVAEGKNMLQVVLDLKLDLPYFCWHPAMGSVGACRQCAVRGYKDENDTRGKIVMACMTPAVEGTRISLNDPEAQEFRRYVIEWLMTNHPHDCPVCDEGGECHLQDMTAMCGHLYRRFRYDKRTFRNQYLGPFVTHEMNRCIQCYRCVRFYRDLAGGRDFDVMGSRNRLYFGRAEDGVLESEFAGNLVEVCPTGVFTDKTLSRHYTRKWDLETAPSVCVHCGLGCNTIPGARYGELRRIRARYNPEVNGYFLCDRGRYGYEFVNSERRIRKCRVDGQETAWNDAIERTAVAIGDAKGIVGIGSPRASLEANHTLRRLVGGDSFSTGLSKWDNEGAQLALALMREGLHSPSLEEVTEADVVLILGADPTNEAPMLDFAIRQAVRRARLDISRGLKIPDWDAYAVRDALQEAKGKLYVASPCGIKLGDIAAGLMRGNLSDIAQIAREMCADRPGELTAQVLADLKSARQPLIVTSVSAGTELIQAAGELARTIPNCWLSVVVPEANTLGVALMGGMPVDEALGRIESGEADTLVVLENDLARRVSPVQFEQAVSKARNVIVLDCIETATTAHASIVLPAPAWVECDGTFVNNETRAQRFYQVFVPEEEASPAWRTLANVTLRLVQGPQEMLKQVQHDVDGSGEMLKQVQHDVAEWQTYEDVLRDLAGENPVFEPAMEVAPPAAWRSAAGRKVARDSHRFSGRTAMHANVTMFEPRPPADSETPLAFSMEGDQNPVPGPLDPRFWWPGWNSANSISKFQIEVNGPLHDGDPGKRLVEYSTGPGAGAEALRRIVLDKPSTGPGAGTEAVGRMVQAERETGSVDVLPRVAIFGSEELSSISPAIAELAPKAEIAMNANLAEKLGIKEGDAVSFRAGGKTITFPCRFDDSIADDVAVIPAGLPETVGIHQPTALETVNDQ